MECIWSEILHPALLEILCVVILLENRLYPFVAASFAQNANAENGHSLLR